MGRSRSGLRWLAGAMRINCLAKFEYFFFQLMQSSDHMTTYFLYMRIPPHLRTKSKFDQRRTQTQGQNVIELRVYNHRVCILNRFNWIQIMNWKKRSIDLMVCDAIQRRWRHRKHDNNYYCKIVMQFWSCKFVMTRMRIFSVFFYVFAFLAIRRDSRSFICCQTHLAAQNAHIWTFSNFSVFNSEPVNDLFTFCVCVLFSRNCIMQFWSSKKKKNRSGKNLGNWRKSTVLSVFFLTSNSNGSTKRTSEQIQCSMERSLVAAENRALGFEHVVLHMCWCLRVYKSKCS